MVLVTASGKGNKKRTLFLFVYLDVCIYIEGGRGTPLGFVAKMCMGESIIQDHSCAFLGTRPSWGLKVGLRSF